MLPFSEGKFQIERINTAAVFPARMEIDYVGIYQGGKMPKTRCLDRTPVNPAAIGRIRMQRVLDALAGGLQIFIQKFVPHWKQGAAREGPVAALVLFCLLACPCAAGTHHIYDGLNTILNDTVFVAGSDTVTIRNSTLTVNSVILAFQGGRIRFENDSLVLNCNLYAWDSARVDFRQCRILWNARYTYQYGITIAGRAAMTMDSTALTIPVSAGMTVTDSAQFIASSSRISGIWTKSAEKNSFMSWTDCAHPFEFIIRDSAGLSFTRCTEVLLWLYFPKGSSGEITMPGDTGWSFLDSFYLGPQSTDLRNIPYEVCMDSVTALWGCIPQAGCSVTVADSKVRGMGFIMDDSALDYHLSHFNHDRLFTQEQLPFPDRSVTLKNTYIRTFNLYPMHGSRVFLDSSVIGEMISYHRSRTSMKHVTVDGSGGFFGLEGGSKIVAEGCTFNCALKIQDSAELRMNWCVAPLTTTIIGRGGLFASNSFLTPSPALLGSARLISVNLSEPANGDTLAVLQPVIADIVNLCGPAGDTAELSAFLLSVSLADTVSRLILPEQPLASGRRLLTNWATNGLAPGFIYLLMPVIVSPGDTLTGLRLLVKSRDNPILSLAENATMPG